MTIRKKLLASILPIRTNEPGTSPASAVPVPENHQHENRSPAPHASTNNRSTGELQDPQEPLKTNIPRFSSLWLHRHWKTVFHTPRGVRPYRRFIVSWLGRIGFIAKGIVYAVMGGLCIATAQHLKGDITGTESPMVCVV
ncbi:TRAPP subunit [Mucor velutinosus]|uniref:TRAPP subunit n=1 Tax=Mucor velutinosus TaxID=708070 RepID=A0AAN7D2M2_9FUNG|nr:TRAPP subunit [Mucor velutinosus]